MKVKELKTTYNSNLLGNGYKHILSPLTREALTVAYISIKTSVASTTDKDERRKLLGLPNTSKYSNIQINKFITALETVVTRLTFNDHELDLISCVGEELMLRTMIKRAELLISTRVGINISEQDLNRFKEEIQNFKSIVEPTIYTDSYLFKLPKGFSEDWFTQFKNVNTNINPYYKLEELGVYLDIDLNVLKENEWK
jgi:hypothetical protein